MSEAKRQRLRLEMEYGDELHRRLSAAMDGLVKAQAAYERSVRIQLQESAACGIEYASMTQPIAIRCQFPKGHRSARHAGFNDAGEVFVFPGDPAVLPELEVANEAKWRKR